MESRRRRGEGEVLQVFKSMPPLPDDSQQRILRPGVAGDFWPSEMRYRGLPWQSLVPDALVRDDTIILF